jgi:hypothetical protein
MKHIELNWRKTAPGHYEETAFGFAMGGGQGAWQVLDPNGKEIYLATFGRQDAEALFTPIPQTPGERVQVSHWEWESTAGWMLKDFRLIAETEDERHGPPDITILHIAAGDPASLHVCALRFVEKCVVRNR